MIVIKQFLIFLVAVMLVPQAVGSEEALRAFFLNVKSLSADFIQRVEDENGLTLELSGGKFYLARPGKFRWDYKNADYEGEPGQQIIADGESLYFYDPELEQVTRRPLSDAVAQVPSLLLVQSGVELDQHFSIADLGLSDALSWVVLKPKADDVGYQQLMIGFDGQAINTLLLYDGLGNSTKLELLNVDSQADLSASVFEFSVPEGVDLLSE